MNEATKTAQVQCTSKATKRGVDRTAGDNQTNYLNAHNRCDADCSGQALTRFTNENGTKLEFCSHHTNRHKEALLNQGFDMVLDETHKLDVGYGEGTDVY